MPTPTLYSNSPGFQTPSSGVILPDVLVTTLRPDIFLVNVNLREVVLFELTCPFERNIESSHAYKEGKYAPLVSDLSRNFKVFHFSVEVGARGMISKANKARLKSFALRCGDVGSTETKKLIAACSKASLLSSFSIFHARNEPSWSTLRPIIVRTDR